MTLNSAQSRHRSIEQQIMDLSDQYTSATGNLNLTFVALLAILREKDAEISRLKKRLDAYEALGEGK